MTLPGWVAPQLATLVGAAPDGADWVHEIKLDGYRMAVRVDNGRVQPPDPDRARLDCQISERHRGA